MENYTNKKEITGKGRVNTDRMLDIYTRVSIHIYTFDGHFCPVKKELILGSTGVDNPSDILLGKFSV